MELARCGGGGGQSTAGDQLHRAGASSFMIDPTQIDALVMLTRTVNTCSGQTPPTPTPPTSPTPPLSQGRAQTSPPRRGTPRHGPQALAIGVPPMQKPAQWSAR